MSSSVSEDLPAPPVPVMPRIGRLDAGGSLQHGLTDPHRVGAILNRGDHARQQSPVSGAERFDRVRLRGGELGEIVVAAAQQIVDHPLQAQLGAVFRGIQAGHSIGLKLANFRRHDDAAAAAEHLDILAAARTQQIHHVLEEFDMPALVGGDGHTLHVLLQCGVDDLLHRAVVAQMNDLGPGSLQHPAHDIDRCIMTVEQRGGGHEPNLVRGLVGRRLGGDGYGAHRLILEDPRSETNVQNHRPP